jgi:hypothetical protein
MTLEAWVYPTAINGWECVLLKEDSNDLAYALYGDNNGNDTGGPRRPVVSIREGSTTYWTPGTAQLATNTWAHLAATYDGSTLRMYVNGTLASSLAQAGSINVTAGVLRIGGNSIWGEYFNGLIDEVRVYSRALSQAQIQTDMNTPIGSPELLMGEAVPAGDAAPLSQQEIRPLFDEAVASWSAALDDPAAVQRLRAVRVEVMDLAGRTLGLASSTVIYLDADGAGHGWFLDATPSEDSEFAPGLADGPAAGRVDLLTVLTHEMGHILGLDDDAAADPITGNVMADVLPPGVRRIHLEGLVPEAPPASPTPPVAGAAPADEPEELRAEALRVGAGRMPEPRPAETSLAPFALSSRAGAEPGGPGRFPPGPPPAGGVAVTPTAVPVTGPSSAPAGTVPGRRVEVPEAAVPGTAGPPEPSAPEDLAGERAVRLEPGVRGADRSVLDLVFVDLGRTPDDPFPDRWWL